MSDLNSLMGMVATDAAEMGEPERRRVAVEEDEKANDIKLTLIGSRGGKELFEPVDLTMKTEGVEAFVRTIVRAAGEELFQNSDGPAELVRILIRAAGDEVFRNTEQTEAYLKALVKAAGSEVSFWDIFKIGRGRR